jgi:hypothetical protein
MFLCLEHIHQYNLENLQHFLHDQYLAYIYI